MIKVIVDKKAIENTLKFLEIKKGINKNYIAEEISGQKEYYFSKRTFWGIIGDKKQVHTENSILRFQFYLKKKHGIRANFIVRRVTSDTINQKVVRDMRTKPSGLCFDLRYYNPGDFILIV